MTSTFVSCIATVALGIARAAIEALIEIASAKTTTGSPAVLRDEALAQADAARAAAVLRSGRAFLCSMTSAPGVEQRRGGPQHFVAQERAWVRLTAKYAVQCAIQAT